MLQAVIVLIVQLLTMCIIIAFILSFFFLMIRRPPRSTRTTHSFPTRRSSDLVRLKLRGEYDHAFKAARPEGPPVRRSEEHTSELQSLMRISYAVFCLKKKKKKITIK